MAIRKTNCNGWCIDTHDHDHVVRPATKPLKRLAGSTIVVGIKSKDRELHKHRPSKQFGNDANVFDLAEAQALATHNIAATTATLPDTQWKLFCCRRAVLDMKPEQGGLWSGIPRTQRFIDAGRRHATATTCASGVAADI